MGDGIHMRIDANGDANLPVERGGEARDQIDFGFRFAVKAVNAGFDRILNLRAGFSDSGENHSSRVSACSQHAIQFTAGDNVKAGSLSGQDSQDGEIGIRLYGEADRMGNAGKGVLIGLKAQMMARFEYT